MGRLYGCLISTRGSPDSSHDSRTYPCVHCALCTGEALVYRRQYRARLRHVSCDVSHVTARLEGGFLLWQPVAGRARSKQMADTRGTVPGSNWGCAHLPRGAHHGLRRG